MRMMRARSALALSLLLCGSVLINAKSAEVSKSLESWETDANEKKESTTATTTTQAAESSLESWEIEEEKENAESTTEAAGAAQATGRRALKGFVTPRPFVVEHPLFSSTWAAWSAWSFCVNNVRIRVRACNTVRGFSCVGKNQETEPCANSLYHHHPARPKANSDYDVVDPYEDDRIEALKQLYPDESPTDVLERRRPNPNFLRIGTTTAAPRKSEPEIRQPSSIEKAEEVEEKDTDKAVQAGQQPEVDFKKAKGAKTETQEVPLQAEIEGALEKLEVHRESETRRQHSASYHIIDKKVPYAHDGSMGTGYTLVRNSGSAFSALDLLESTEETTTKSSSTMHDADMDKEKKSKKIQKSKAALAKISQLLDYEIDALEKKVTTKSSGGGAKGSGLRAVFKSRGEEAPESIGNDAFVPKKSKFAGAYVGAKATTSASRAAGNTSDKEKGSDYVEYSQYSDVDEHGKRVAVTPKPKTAATKGVHARSTIYDEAVLDTDKASYDEYEEWIGDDKGSKEIINRRTNVKKGGQHDSSNNIPVRPKASRTTIQTGATPPPSTTTTTVAGGKQKKINFDHSDFLKEILVADYSDYEDVNSQKLDGDAKISTTTSAPVRRVTTPVPKVTISRNDQLNKVHELENLLGLPHQGLMDETLHHQTNPVVWATPSPQFRSEGAFHSGKRILKKKKLNRAKMVATVDIDNVEVDKQTNMVDSDDHTFEGDSVVAPKTHVSQKVHQKKKILRTMFREQPALLDNDDYSGVKGYSPYPSMRKPLTRGPPKKKSLSIGVTGKRHRAIHDGQKGQEIIKSHKMLFSKRTNLRRYLNTFITKKTTSNRAPMAINDDTVRALDWMMQTLGAPDLLEPAKKPAKYSHTRVNSNARAEISAGIQQTTRKGSRIESVAIGSPLPPQRRPAPIRRPAKILRPRKPVVAYKSSTVPTRLHDSDLLVTEPLGGISRMKPLRKSAHGVIRNYQTTTPLPAYPPDLRASPPRQKSLTPVLEGQPLNLLPPPLDEASDQVRYPRNGAYGTGFELDGSSPDAASYLAAEATARPAKALLKRGQNRGENRARGVKTVTGVERKRFIGGAYTSSSGAAAFPSKFVDQKAPPRQPVAGLPEQYLKSGSTMIDGDSLSPKKETNEEKKPVPFVMHDGAMDERNTIAAEIERLEQLVNENKEHFNAPTFSDKGSPLALPKEFEPLLSDPRLFEDALKEIKEENKALGVDAILADGAQGASFSGDKKRPGSDARWSPWGDWGECLCGQQLRTRACETADGTQVSGCKGSSYESRACSGGSCPKA